MKQIQVYIPAVLLLATAPLAAQTQDAPGRSAPVVDEALVEREIEIEEPGAVRRSEPVGEVVAQDGQLTIEDVAGSSTTAAATESAGPEIGALGTSLLRAGGVNVLTADDVQLQVRTAAFSEAAFTPRSANEEMEMGFGQGGAYLATIVGSEGGLIAPISLPDGARITRFSAHSWDDTNAGGANLTIRLQRILLASGGYQNIATVSTFAGGGVVEDFTTLSHTVDNSIGAYQVFVTGAVDVDRRIRAVEITYEIPGI